MVLSEVPRKNRGALSTREGTKGKVRVTLGACTFTLHTRAWLISGPNNQLMYCLLYLALHPKSQPEQRNLAYRIVDSTLAKVTTGRQAHLKRFAEANCQDEIVIAEARKRIKMRDIQRESLQLSSKAEGSDDLSDASYQAAEEIDPLQSVKQEQDTHSIGTIGDQRRFAILFEKFRDAYDHMDPEDALDCPSCGEYRRDDPILTSCLCVYCTEYFTEMLANVSKADNSQSMPCAAYANERIKYSVSLTPVQIHQAFVYLYKSI